MKTECSAEVHDECDPDTCFTAKLRYMRERGANIHVPTSFKAVRN